MCYTYISQERKGHFKMKSNYKVRAEKFLRSIYNDICANLNSPCEIDTTMWAYAISHKRKIWVKWGCSRCAIITSDYVIKWDYDAGSVAEVGGVELESTVYERAVNAGYGYLFAECTLIEIDGHIFSIMPRINGIGRYAHKKGAIENYLTDDEINFINGIIIDMHSENWGLKNNYPVIIDYAYTVELCESW